MKNIKLTRLWFLVWLFGMSILGLGQSELQRGRVSGFTLLSPAQTGLIFSNTLSVSKYLTNQLMLDGSGVALGDVDSDGLPDIFLGSAGGRSALWRNQGGWRFKEMTETAFPQRAVSIGGDVTGSAMADLNGDGILDLVLNTHADGIRILLNRGLGVFQPFNFTQVSARGGHSLAIADVDGDGWLDIYVCNYRQRALMDLPNARATFRREGGRTVVATLDGRSTAEADLVGRFVVSDSGAIEELGEPDVLYRNLGGTNFIEVPWTSGAFCAADGHPLQSPPRDWGLAAQFQDINGDERPDLYVCNDFQTPDHLWINESTLGKPRFRLIESSALRHTSQFSMGVDFADLNGDNRPDFVVLDMLSSDPVRRLTLLDGTSSTGLDATDSKARLQFDANTLFLQRADGSFAEVAAMAGVMATDWSWTPICLDVDLDGWPDLLISAGQERGSRDLDVAEQLKVFRRSGLRTDAQIFRERLKFPRLDCPIRAFRNRGVRQADSVPHFEDMGEAWGFGDLAVHHGMALADLDGDGDLDLVVSRLNDVVAIYRNESRAPRVSLRLQSTSSNTEGIGARLTFRWQSVSTGAIPIQTSQMIAGGRYLSGDEARRTFACPGEGRGLLEVRWPSGLTEVWTNLAAGVSLRLREGLGTLISSDRKEMPRPRLQFEVMEPLLNSARSGVDEFTLQPGLPRRQNVRTPTLLWTSEGVFVGGDTVNPIRRMGFDGVIKNVGSDAPQVTTGMAQLEGGIVGSGNGSNPLFWIESGKGKVLLGFTNDTSCVAVSRTNVLGLSWIFAGGAPVSGAYPRASASGLLRREKGVVQSAMPLPIGLVNGAVFVDLVGDTQPELVVVTDWGAPIIFGLAGAEVTRWDPLVILQGRTEQRLSALTGLWQSVIAEDFDGDGRQDLVLGNWGLNSFLSLYAGAVGPAGSVRVLRLHSGPLDQPGSCMESYIDGAGVERPMRSLAELGPRYPWLQERFATHRSFALASIGEVLQGRIPSAPALESRWMGSLILFNRGDHFEGRLLPDAVQMGPVFSMVSADFDGDGRKDLYCAQGFAGHNFGGARDDTGEGVFLLSRQPGEFEAVPMSETGVRILGEQRGVVAGDMDKDGRVDLVVGVHGGPIFRLKNRSVR
ncbi:MAG: hypothetical protein EXS25_04000 [Pedosphaera sp.]|nr:hypothetical protein [Pedosphaera sp.]